MSRLFFISSVFFAVYLLFQAVEDARTKTVYAAANNAAILLVSALYAGKCAVLGEFPSVAVPATVFALLATHRFLLGKVMGVGDAKAYAALFVNADLKL